MDLLSRSMKNRCRPKKIKEQNFIYSIFYNYKIEKLIIHKSNLYVYSVIILLIRNTLIIISESVSQNFAR